MPAAGQERKAKEEAKTEREMERKAQARLAALSAGPAVEITGRLIVHRELEVLQLAMLDLPAAARHQARLPRNRARPRVSTTGHGRLLPWTASRDLTAHFYTAIALSLVMFMPSPSSGCGPKQEERNGKE